KQGDWEINWNDIEPWWLAAEIDGVVEGAVQVCPAKPIARVEMLAINPELSHKDRGRVVLKLDSQWREFVRQSGASGLAGVIPDELYGYLRVAKRRGYVSVAEGHVMMGRV
ncbi:unnamed protein product, partial [marine sediment metagenome]